MFVTTTLQDPVLLASVHRYLQELGQCQLCIYIHSIFLTDFYSGSDKTKYDQKESATIKHVFAVNVPFHLQELGKSKRWRNHPYSYLQYSVIESFIDFYSEIKRRLMMFIFNI
jgi:hypothetical protein